MENTTKTHEKPPFIEFVIIISLMMSITALSTDSMLPALSQIGEELNVVNANDPQLIVSALFLGMAVGQLFFGPLSDSMGRKRPVFIGFGIFIFGSILSATANNFNIMLAGRLIQGLGISGPRAIIMALVRDRYKGRLMARVMSFVMTVFILVPMLAPTIGQAVMSFSGWRGIFVSLIVFSLIAITWFGLRMPETLPKEHRSEFSIRRIFNATREIVGVRIAIGYTISTGLIGGAFLGYLNSAQQIFAEQYALGDLFPIFFAAVSGSLGLASFSNSRLVMRYGMRLLVHRALQAILALAAVGLTVAILTGGQPPLWFLMTYLMLTFFSIGILFGNQNAMAMDPLGHLAGMGAAIVGSLSTLVQMPLGTLIGQSYNGTVIPLLVGIASMAVLSLIVVTWAEKGQTPEGELEAA